MSEPLTPEQLAHDIANGPDCERVYRDGDTEYLSVAIAAAIRAAVAAEREACARTVELAPTRPELCDLTDIAAAIRARGEPTA